MAPLIFHAAVTRYHFDFLPAILKNMSVERAFALNSHTFSDFRCRRLPMADATPPHTMMPAPLRHAPRYATVDTLCHAMASRRYASPPFARRRHTLMLSCYDIFMPRDDDPSEHEMMMAA